jgi:GAF domain-containing protein
MRSDPDAPGFVATPPGERAGVLLAVAQAVAAHADLSALLRDLGGAVAGHFPPGYLSFALVDPGDRTARLQYLEPIGGADPPKAADTPTELPAGESPAAFVWSTQQPLWLEIGAPPDGRFPVLRAALGRQGVRAAFFAPLTTPRRKLGAMGFASYRRLAPAPGDLEFVADVARLVALAVEGALTRGELELANVRLTRERDRLELLNEVGHAVTARLDMPGLLRAVTAGLRKLVGLPLTALYLPDPDGTVLRSPATDAAGDDPFGTAAGDLPIDGTPAGEAFRSGRTVRLGSVPSHSGAAGRRSASWPSSAASRTPSLRTSSACSKPWRTRSRSGSRTPRRTAASKNSRPASPPKSSTSKKRSAPNGAWTRSSAGARRCGACCNRWRSSPRPIRPCW